MATPGKYERIEVLVQGHWLAAYVNCAADEGEAFFCAHLDGPANWSSGLSDEDEGILWRRVEKREVA